MLQLMSLLALAGPALAQASCPSSDANPCSTPSPGGLFLFRQRFEPDKGDQGQWGIDGLDVLDCSSKPIASAATARPYTHEEIGSFCATHPSFGKEYEVWEKDWAESEVGEGVEEMWERAWATAGQLVSTLEPKCFNDYIRGQEVPTFFDTLHHLHDNFNPWEYLAENDITPSRTVGYSRQEIVDSLAKLASVTPYITCVNHTISTIHWPLTVVGKFQDRQFEPAAVTDFSSDEELCPADGIVYPVIANLPPPEPVHTWDPIIRPSPRALNQDAMDGVKRPPGAHDKVVNVERLGFFKKVDETRDSTVDSGEEWGAEAHKRRPTDEL